jgi:hypothetical protein
MSKLESAAHVVLLGGVLGFVLGELAIPLYLIREFTSWRLPWPMKGQWPPGDPLILSEDLLDRGVYLDHVARYRDAPVGPPPRTSRLAPAKWYAPLDRVRDMANDLVETLSGWIVGNLAQKGMILWLIF